MIADKQLLKVYDDRIVSEEAQAVFQSLNFIEKARLSELVIERQVFEQ